MARILTVLPDKDFDPTEAGVPWHVLTSAGHEVFFANETGGASECDQMTLQGLRLDGHPMRGLLKSLVAKPENVGIYRRMEDDKKYQAAKCWQDIDPEEYDALVLPGGHAPGMKPYLESPEVYRICRNFFERKAPIASVCHGVLALARTKRDDGQSVLYGYQVTGLNNFQEKTATKMTRRLFGEHYRTYPCTVQDEVGQVLAKPSDFKPGPVFPSFGTSKHPDKGFTVRDRHVLSARWPGDVWKLATEFKAMLG